jgi:hypothetical protein
VEGVLVNQNYGTAMRGKKFVLSQLMFRVPRSGQSDEED